MDSLDLGYLEYLESGGEGSSLAAAGIKRVGGSESVEEPVQSILVVLIPAVYTYRSNTALCLHGSLLFLVHRSGSDSSSGYGFRVEGEDREE